MNLLEKKHHKSVLVLLNKMCSSLLNIFLCLKSKQSVMIRWWCSCLQHYSVLMTNKSEINNQKALKHIWQQLLKSSASQTVVKRHCLCGGLAHTESSYPGSPASKLTQALYPLRERHLYRTVTSGRLGAKRLHLSEFLSKGIFRAVGEFQLHWLVFFIL